MSRTTEPVIHTINEWALELGKDDATIRRRLVKLGLKVDNSTKVRGRDVFLCLNSDKDADLRRKVKAEADLLEQDVEREAGETFKWSEVQKLITDSFVLPVTQFLSSLPSTYNVIVNPHDPELALKGLQQLVDDMKKILREKLPKPDIEK